MPQLHLLGSFEEVRRECDLALATWVTTIDASLPDAIRGDRLAARSYATAYVDLVHFLCAHLAVLPEEQKWLARVARREAIAVPFRSCLIDDRAGPSVALTVVKDLRLMVPDAPTLHVPGRFNALLSSTFDVDDRGVHEFERVVDQVVDASASPLEEVMDTFDLSYTDTGRLFGVTRQAVKNWLREGPPPDRQAKIVTVAQVATLLRRYLINERIPGIARKPAAAYDGRSMLEMIGADEHLRLLELTRRSFDWERTA